VFPSQFELTLSWNPTVAGSLHPLRSVNKTNYVQGHIKIDQHTNRLKMDTKYSTLSLEPQELVSYILDFSEKLFYLKQKNSCKCFDIILKNIVGPSHSNDDGKAEKDSQPGAGFDFEVETLPNVAELFDLFPYVMYYTGQRSVDQQPMHEFKYSYPLGKAQADNDAELLKLGSLKGCHKYAEIAVRETRTHGVPFWTNPLQRPPAFVPVPLHRPLLLSSCALSSLLSSQSFRVTPSSRRTLGGCAADCKPDDDTSAVLIIRTSGAHPGLRRCGWGGSGWAGLGCRG
jgi:hypothetical protein